ncbi:hypothetical protein GX411_04480 [Candidatus Fermentibacteria bacterium]|nr:hypothetical protein [Candidatus Fermentibacteria bacterium]
MRSSSRSRRPPGGLMRPILIELGIILLLALVFSAGMRIANRRLGAESPAEDLQSDTLPVSGGVSVPDIASSMPEQQTGWEGPESAWESTPCSLFVSASSRAVMTELPEAPSVRDIPLETLLVVRNWASLSGTEEADLEKVYSFNRRDTLYVDLPRTLDFEGLKRTVEGRFVCYTRMFVLVAGMPVSGYPDGIPLRGVAGTFD